MSTPDPQTRIADSDRERAMSDLAGHYADGRLDHEEYDERLDAIWTARTRGDLAVIFSDLPRPQATYPSPPARAESRRTGGRRFPVLPVIAVLVVLSAVTNAPFWLLIFPLMFVRARRGAGCAPSHGHGFGHGGRGDYRRPGRSHGV
jgi:hypothetical protein